MSTDTKKILAGSVIRARESDLTDELCGKLGYAFAVWLAKRMNTTPDLLAFAVGRDSRASGPRLCRALIDGLTRADVDVYDCGMATTPAIQMAIEYQEIDCDGAVMVTASALDGEMNGFKLFTRDGSVTGGEIEEIVALALSVKVPRRLVKPLSLMDAYRSRLNALVHNSFDEDVQLPLLGLRVVVDASGGAGGFYADFLASLGADTQGSLNLEPDGRFTAHLPNPENPDALDALSKAVLRTHADLGVIFDADGDRAAIIDQDGKAINRNRLIALIAAIFLDEKPGQTFVTDSVTSSGLTRFINEWGGVHYRFRRGYRNVIEEAERLNEEGIDCPIAIETSGHAALRENYFIDDGMYLATKLICEAMYRKRDGQKLSCLLDGLSEPVESLEVRLPIIQEDFRKAAGYVIEAVLSHTLNNPAWRLAKDNREGVRILFSIGGGVDNAWFMLRLSVHDPVMPLNAESDVPGGVEKMLTELYDLISIDNEELDLTPLRAAIDKMNNESKTQE